MTQAAEELKPNAFEFVCEQTDKSTWLAMRGTGIGASEIASVIGCGFLGRLELYFQKTGEQERDDEETELMRLGKRLERGILEEVLERAEVNEDESLRGALLRSTEHSWMLATPDAVTVDGEPVEVKNMTFGYDEDAWAEGIPEKYYLQCHQQMIVLGAQRCLFGCLVWGNRIIWEWVERDETTVRRIIAAGSLFWNQVQTRTEPKSDGHQRSRKALSMRAANTDEDEDPVELFAPEMGVFLDQFERALLKSEQAKADAKRAQKELDIAKDNLAQALGPNRSGFTSTGWTIRWKTTSRKEYTVKATTFTQLEIKPPKD